jgi:nicotinate-nucleotide pyrophosphorylase (carboxylating)
MAFPMKIKEIDAVIAAALREDMPQGDITSENIIPARSVSRALFLAKQEGILAGIEVARRVLKRIDRRIIFKKLFKDGQPIKPGDVLAEVEGDSISILKGERTALNFLQRMSGIATTTREFVDAISGTKARILDTRKTTPGLRIFEKYAVKMGGGKNHRLNLSTMVLIKDNHLRLVGDIPAAVEKARRKVKRGIKIEVEVTDFKQAREAVQAGADMIMLDNVPLKKMREIIDWVKGRIPVEVSGNVCLKNVRRIALLGPEYISVGRLTHSYASLDLSLEFLDHQRGRS